MKNFEMNFYWDDNEQAQYSGTKTHKQNGLIKTWKLDYETDERFQARTRELINCKVRFLGDVTQKMGGKFAGIDNYKFG